MKASAPHGMFYGWVVVLVSFGTLVLVMGTRFSFGVFYTSMLDSMGWSRAATAGIFSVSMLVYAVVAMGVGAAFDWLGPRRLFPLAAVLLGIGLFLCSRITTLWQFYLYYGVIVGTAFTALGFIPHVSLMARWFERRRGLATSLMLSGTGAGSLLLAPVSEALIARYGWQQSYLVYAVVIPTVLIPLTLFFHRTGPEDLGLQPDGVSRPAASGHQGARRPETTEATSYTTALITRAFWALSGIVFVVAFNHMMLIVHQNQYLVDIGFSQTFAAWMLGLSGILRSAGGVLWGLLSDRMTRETSFTISTLLGVVALLWLISAQAAPDAWRVVLSITLMGLGYGGASIIYATSAADLFQGRHFGTILGLMEIGFGLGASLGSYTAGFIFDRYQTYLPSFYIVIALMLVSIVGIWVAAPRAARAASVSGAGRAAPPVRRQPRP